MTDRIVVEVDSRRRVSLGKIGRHRRYLVHEEPDGTLIMEPATVLTEAEVRVMGAPGLLDRIERNRTHPELRRRRTP